MNSFLIVSPDKTKRQTRAQELCDEEQIDTFDRTIITRAETEEGKQKLSLGIDDVKNLHKKLYLKPLRSEKKAIILEDAHLLTTEAQNAILKVLEEPPMTTLLILTAESKDALLPTILSRCTLIDLRQDLPKLTEEEKQKMQEILKKMPEWGSGEALKQAEIVAKNKENALSWLEKMIIVAREDMLRHSERSEEPHQYLVFLKSLQGTHRQIKSTNVNLRLALENLFLSQTP